MRSSLTHPFSDPDAQEASGDMFSRLQPSSMAGGKAGGSGKAVHPSPGKRLFGWRTVQFVFIGLVIGLLAGVANLSLIVKEQHVHGGNLKSGLDAANAEISIMLRDHEEDVQSMAAIQRSIGVLNQTQSMNAVQQSNSILLANQKIDLLVEAVEHLQKKLNVSPRIRYEIQKQAPTTILAATPPPSGGYPATPAGAKAETDAMRNDITVMRREIERLKHTVQP